MRQKAAEAYKQQAAQVAAAAAAPTQQNTTVIRPAPPAPHHQCSVASAQAGSKPQGGSQLLDLEQLKSAPRFGLNARELILQAAGMVAAEQQPAGPRAAAMAQAGSSARLPAAAAAVAAGVQGVKGPSSSRPRLNGHKLVEAYPPSERPFVQYNPRSCIPRVQRQVSRHNCTVARRTVLTLLSAPHPPDMDAGSHTAVPACTAYLLHSAHAHAGVWVCCMCIQCSTCARGQYLAAVEGRSDK